ncbi:hypothetical protein Gotri_000895 [Gossypium trilobum]|uniref:Glutathione S-transferase TCHQD n=1 Tax=Gossypium trilobum TaxID=34281 RepID=A0A7J9FCZ8_9ROSI|nr:hypothetical protein [Gossypium trilobum]
MQLYHHPCSLNSQKVRLALEEKGVDYTSFHVNPILGKNMDSSFFRMNTSAKLPVFKNGSHIIFDTIETILYVLYLSFTIEICIATTTRIVFMVLGNEFLKRTKGVLYYSDSSFFCKIFVSKTCVPIGHISESDTHPESRYIERIAVVSVGNDSFSNQEVIEWMQKIQQWNPKYFTLLHIPDKHRLYVSKFIRKVVIARMAESPDLASAYHSKLREAYETEEKLKNADLVKRSTESLVQLLDEVERKLNDTTYIVGDEFTMADATFVPVLARLVLLGLEDEYISCRPNIADYWGLVQQRPTYKKVIGKYFNGWRKKKTLIKTWGSLHIRNLLKRY